MGRAAFAPIRWCPIQRPTRLHRRRRHRPSPARLATIEIVSPSGALVAVHRRATGVLVRMPEHRAALEAAVIGVFSTARPCVPKGNHPPGPAARAAHTAVALRGPEAREVVVDLARYAELVEAAR